jgi:hypothetical protein
MPIAHDMNDAALNTAIRDREHLVRFLNASGREFFVMKSEDLIRAFPSFEAGVLAVQNIVSCYRDHRRSIPTDRVAGTAVNPVTLRTEELPVMKGEELEPDEYDELIAWAEREKASALERIARTAKGAAR